MYDKDYLTETLFSLSDILEDLEKWSAYNNDKYNSEISDLRSSIEILGDAINE